MSTKFDLSSPSDLGYSRPRKEGKRVRGGGKGGGMAPAVTLDTEPGEDPFGLEPAMRQLVLPAVRFPPGRYWGGGRERGAPAPPPPRAQPAAQPPPCPPPRP